LQGAQTDRFQAGAVLDRLATAFARADSDAVVHRKDENLTITDFTVLTAASPFKDRVDRGLYKRFVHGNLKLHFSQQIDAEFVTAVDAGLTFLSAETLAIHHGEPKNFDLRQRLFDGFQFAGLDDGDNQLHGNESRPKGDPGWWRDRSKRQQ